MALLQRLPELNDLTLPNMRKLCFEVLRLAEKLDAFVGKRCQTLIHGDCKGWNLFLKKDGQLDLTPVILIDMQWCGKGEKLLVVPAAKIKQATLLQKNTLILSSNNIEYHSSRASPPRCGVCAHNFT